jgi:protocatechuate 3,4-dioxygenase alpha subunit
MTGRTPSQTVGPFFAIGLCREAQNEVVPGGDVRVVGHVVDGAGEPIPDAVVEWWQQGEGATTRWGRCGTDAAGRFEFVTARPADGVADVIVFARGLLKHLVTRCYFPGATDEVLDAVEAGSRESLVAREEDGVLRWDVRVQGDEQTVFFAV